MSRRYGRNQKRRHREEIERLLVQNGILMGALAAARHAHEEARRTLRDFEGRLQQRFPWSTLVAAVEDAGVPLEALLAGGFVRYARMDSSVFLDPRQMEGAPTDTLRGLHVEVPMFVFEALLDLEDEPLSREVHMLLRGPAGSPDLRYAISVDALIAASHMPALVREMGQRFAEFAARRMGPLKEVRAARPPKITYEGDPPRPHLAGVPLKLEEGP